MNKTNPPQRPKRAQRSDGRSTRAVVLEAAGKVFAERGFAEATSKEICERAGTNGAAVNYYFGGKEGLYEEVLIEAHRQMLSLEDLNRIITSEATPEEKLRVFLKHIIRTAMNASELWGIRIFLRELASPSPFVPKFITTAVFPKSQKLRELIRDITGLPPDSPAMQRATALVALPCMGLILFRKATHLMLPATAGDAEACLKTCWRICRRLRAWGKRPGRALTFEGRGNFQKVSPPPPNLPTPFKDFPPYRIPLCSFPCGGTACRFWLIGNVLKVGP
ncbi:TetR/AcrR family transcriptional regulator [Bilophila wadsworthia]|uniref:TetR/AcrR family transcriptional regulator n=1 Tax=Bilophila wadsworthia TaxID=35833 RepID=UPI003990E0F0